MDQAMNLKYGKPSGNNDDARTKCAHKRCDCHHPFQDSRYGKGVRVHNPIRSNRLKWRCTVCGKDKE